MVLKRSAFNEATDHRTAQCELQFHAFQLDSPIREMKVTLSP